MPGARHDAVEFTVAMLIGGFVKSRGLGRPMVGETFIRTRRPRRHSGFGFLLRQLRALSATSPLPAGPLEVPPELVVEVRSPSDRWKLVNEKIAEYHEAGVKVVMVIDPVIESVGVFREDEFPIIFHNGDTVTLPDVLPGFAAPVKAFFE